jgi:DNA-binding CsgD family transcriptional regulator
MSPPNSAPPPRQESAWLDHLELLAELPYPAPVLMPAILAAVRTGFRADLGFFVWVSGPELRPVAIWAERTNGTSLSIMKTRMGDLFKDFPLDIQLQSDGDLIRQMQAQAGDEHHWVYTEALNPLGVHWGISAPLRDRRGDCVGFLYIYRAKADGPFSDEDNRRLKRARDRLKGLALDKSCILPPCPHRFRHAASFVFDGAGNMVARGLHGVELLYLYQDLGEHLLDWNADDLSALPGQARGLVAGLLADLAAGRRVDALTCHAELPAGRFDFHAEPLTPTGTGGPQVVVRVSHQEPLDIALARLLKDQAFSLQEKRILIASTRKPSLKDLAGHLGITVGTLKSYINRLQAKAGLRSRQAIVDQVLGASDRH